MHRDSGRRGALALRTWRGMILVAAAALTAPMLLTAPSTAADAPPSQTLIGAVMALAGRSTDPAAVDGSTVVGTMTATSGQRHAFAVDIHAAVSPLRDLGTLGGTESHAGAVDGKVVVGWSTTSSGAIHAFAYDLGAASPVMRDLGVAPGYTRSTAVAVDGDVVVGQMSSSPTAPTHAFAYDLGAASPTMLDLGTLGGNYSTPSAVAGTVVVGQSSTPGPFGSMHAFALDLASATPEMRDLGTLGGDYAAAVDIDGTVVAGNSRNARGEARAFAYDVGATAPVMRDLGTLGGYSSAYAIDGGVVVGQSADSRGAAHAFAFDLANGRMRDLGDLGGRFSIATAISGRVVVGRSARAGDQKVRAFAYDLDAARPRMTDLGGYLRADPSQAADVAGSLVVGLSGPDVERGRGVVWSLRTDATPAFEFTRFRYSVQESADRATVTVERAGNRSRPVSVQYSTRGVSAVAGRDYRTVRGTVRFAAGQIRRSFSVPILDDRLREKEETVLLTLSGPSGSGAILGTPNAAALVIRASDQRPDGWVSTRASSGFSGNNVYNSSGRGQTKTLIARRTQTRTFHVRVYNDGLATNTFVVRGTPARAGSTVRYLDSTTDMTRALRSRAGFRLTLAPRAYKAFTVRIAPTRSAAIGSLKPATLITTWRGDGTRSDTVRAVARVAR